MSAWRICASGSRSGDRRSSRTPTPCSTAETRTELIPLCAEHGIAYQAFSPLAGGWLTGKYRRDEAPPAGSRMTHAARAVPRIWRTSASTPASTSWGAWRRDRGVSTAGLALAWALGGTGSVVVGPRRPEHLEPVYEALLLELSPADSKKVGSLFT